MDTLYIDEKHYLFKMVDKYSLAEKIVDHCQVFKDILAYLSIIYL